MEFILGGILAVVGFFVGFFIHKFRAQSKVNNAENNAEKIIAEAKVKQTEILLDAQGKALKTIEEAKKEEERRRQEVKELQSRLEKRENSFSQKLLELQEKQQQLYDKVNQVEEVKGKIKQIKEEQLAKLEKIAGMTKDEAKEVLFKNVEEQIKDDIVVRIGKLEREATAVWDEKARDLMASSMQRLVCSYTAEITTTAVEIPSDEMKGRIIGREGRNIKVIEQLTGTEIIVDDTPNVITVSGFSPIRRHIAKRALDKLVADGRIHPGRIEESIE